MEYNDDPNDTTSGWLRQTYGVIPTSTQEYKVERTTVASIARWCGYVNNVQQLCVDASAINLASSDRVIYAGESTLSTSQIGGTDTSRYRMTHLAFRRASDGVWTGTNTNSLRELLSAGTQYRINKGFDNGLNVPYIENWTLGF